MASVAKALRELGRRNSRVGNAASRLRQPRTQGGWKNGTLIGSLAPSTCCAYQVQYGRSELKGTRIFSSFAVAGAGEATLFRRREGRNVELAVGLQMPRHTFEEFPSVRLPILAFSRSSSGSTRTGAASSAGKQSEKPEENKKQLGNRTVGGRLKNLLSALEAVPVSALGLGLAGAIPFVGLTPGIASLLPLPEGLFAIHSEAQAVYGAVILTFLGGPHWGLAMADSASVSSSKFSRHTIRSIRFIWSVSPSLVAWIALLLDPVPKFSLLIVSFGVVLGVDALFAWMKLVPPWYMPLRILLTGIAMLSLTSSLIVIAATTVTQ